MGALCTYECALDIPYVHVDTERWTLNLHKWKHGLPTWPQTSARVSCSRLLQLCVLIAMCSFFFTSLRGRWLRSSCSPQGIAVTALLVRGFAKQKDEFGSRVRFSCSRHERKSHTSPSPFVCVYSPAVPTRIRTSLDTCRRRMICARSPCLRYNWRCPTCAPAEFHLYIGCELQRARRLVRRVSKHVHTGMSACARQVCSFAF